MNLSGATSLGANDQSTDETILTNESLINTSYTADQLRSGEVSLTQIFGEVKSAVTPVSGSPVIDNGDPSDDADGEESDIGAVSYP